MDNIWDRNPSKSKVIGRCVRDEKAEWPRRTDKVESYKNAFVNGCLVVATLLLLYCLKNLLLYNLYITTKPELTWYVLFLTNLLRVPKFRLYVWLIVNIVLNYHTSIIKRMFWNVRVQSFAECESLNKFCKTRNITNEIH